MADPTVLFNFPPAGASFEQLSPGEYDQAIRSYLQTLDGINPYFWIAGALGEEKLLNILDPAVNTIPYLYVLSSQITALLDQGKNASLPDNIRPGGELFAKLATFLGTFDPIQIRYVGKTWRRVIEQLHHIVHSTGTPAVALIPIRNAMTRMDPSLGTFTSTHLLYLRLCHEVRAHYEALPVLDQYIHSFPSTPPFRAGEFTLPCANHFTSAGYITTASGLSAKISVADIQEYFLLGANTYLAVRQWRQAQLSLEYILTTPAQNVASGLMAEAYRKWVLVSCLVDSSAPLKGANSLALRSIKAASKAYDTLVDVFNAGDPARLHAEIDTGAHIWHEDANMGLVRELQAHHSKVFVKNLQKTYAAAPLTTVATWTNKTPEAVEQYLQVLIDDGFLNAAIEQSAGVGKVLRFHGADHGNLPGPRGEEQQLLELMNQARKTQELADHTKAATHRLTITREHVDYARKRAKNKETDPSLGGETMDTSWEAYDQDEDMMADL